jgi:hypothetical protein
MLVLLAVVLSIRFFIALGTQIFSHRGMVVVLFLSVVTVVVSGILRFPLFLVVATDTPSLLLSFGPLIVVSLSPLLVVVWTASLSSILSKYVVTLF